MRNSILVALLGIAAIPAIPAGATTTNFNFTACGDSGSSSCNSDLSSYSVTVGGATATAVAVYATGTSSGPGSSDITAGEVGSYSGDGIGICENQTSNDCSQPNHQIDNSTNTSPTRASGTTYDYEFMLIEFSSAVDLSQIQLGNWGTTGSTTADPFLATYFTTSSTASLSSIESALEGTTVGGIAGTDGFSSAMAGTCSTGQTELVSAGNENGGYNDNCSVGGNGVDSLSGTDVTYLLIGASTSSANAGNDFFKIQGISTTPYGASATPEPATFGLIGSALIGLGFISRKRKVGTAEADGEKQSLGLVTK